MCRRQLLKTLKKLEIILIVVFWLAIFLWILICIVRSKFDESEQN